MKGVIVIGAGLAGSEAAWQLAKRGIPVELWEMRPKKFSPAHKTEYFAELVCSNSLKSNSLDTASGLLKAELRLFDSLIMQCADATRVPAGGALAVDRIEFSKKVTHALSGHPLIKIVHQELKSIPSERPIIIASGPLTEGKLKEELTKLTGEDYFYFFDAASPIVTKDSIDMDKVFFASRYNKGEGSYINCPLTRLEYEIFYNELVNAKTYPKKEFEKNIFFEGCVPIEELAKRGFKTLTFGPLKPVGLVDPKTGKNPYAVVQMRQEDKEGNLYNLVGFQTNLTWTAQKQVFTLIPGLEEAEFVRYGVMHRNSFINAPRLLLKTNQLREKAGVFLAGQITGVEGYLESVASGLVAGLNAGAFVRDEEPIMFPEDTAIGALHNYLSSASQSNFQPMNINFGLFPTRPKKIKNRRERNLAISQKALASMKNFAESIS